VAVWRIAVRRILEQEIGNTRRSRIGSYVHNDDHHHPLYARWLGSICRRVSRHGRERCLSHEGCRSSCRVLLPPEARRRSRFTKSKMSCSDRWAACTTPSRNCPAYFHERALREQKTRPTVSERNGYALEKYSSFGKSK